MTEPQSVPADGNLKVVYVETIADPAHPTHTECTAVSAVDLSCYLTDEGYNPALDEQTVTDNRLCSRKTFQQPGRSQDSLDVAYVYNIAVPEEDLARLTLVEGVTGFLVCRWGQDFEDDLAAADIVDVIPFKAGVQMKNKPAANTVLTIGQKIFITSPGVQRDVAITAS